MDSKVACFQLHKNTYSITRLKQQTLGSGLNWPAKTCRLGKE